MTRGPIEPATVVFDANGTPYSPLYGDVYHSASGGLEQARHVFLAGNGLPARWQGRESFAVLETGFGLGLNFLATWQAWRDDPRRPHRLHYLAIEKHPFRAADLARLHARYPTLAPLSRELIAAWPSLVAGFHRRHFEGEAIVLTLIFADAREAVPNIGARIDAFYLDGFSPAKNPEMWSSALLGELAWLAAEDATLATWSVAGAVRQALQETGFAVEKKPGFGGKKEMLAARFVSKPAFPGRSRPREVAIIGAGIAGLSCAERLAARSIAVTVFERQAEAGRETSGHHQAVLLPMLAVEETRLHRLHRSAFLYARHRFARLAHGKALPFFFPCGVFQIGRDAEHQRRQQRIVEEGGFPADFVEFLTQQAGAERVGAPVGGPGWWFAQGGWLAPVRLFAILQETARPRISLRLATKVEAIEPDDAGWRLLGYDGKPLWRGDAVILAQAMAIRALPQAAHLPLRPFRGQASLLPAERLADLPRCVVCREGYLTPAHAGLASLGATFQRSEDREPTLADHEKNLARLATMLPSLKGCFSATDLRGHVGIRPVSPDKLPLLGALPLATAAHVSAHVEWPRHHGLYVASGYGARGFVWAPLMAELLACQLCDEPLPVAVDLAAAVDPARFPFRGQM